MHTTEEKKELLEEENAAVEPEEVKRGETDGGTEKTEKAEADAPPAESAEESAPPAKSVEEPAEPTEEPAKEATASAEEPTKEPAKKARSEKEAFDGMKKGKAKTIDFSAWLVAHEKYSVEEGLAIIRERLRAYHYLDQAFLKNVVGRGAFTVKKLFVPVYRMSATAHYYWKVGKKNGAVENTMQKEVTGVLTNAEAYLKATEIGEVKTVSLSAPMKEEELLAVKKSALKECVKCLKEKAEALSPDKRAEQLLVQERYEVVYVPVLRAEIAFEGKTYVEWVNLVNGACEAVYAVSAEATSAAEQAVLKAAARRRSIFASFFYALTFTVLNVLHWLVGGGAEQGADGGTEGLMLTLILGGLSVLTLVFWGACFRYKKAKLVAKAVHKGKLPSANGAAFLSVLAFLLAVACAVIFAVFVVI